MRKPFALFSTLLLLAFTLVACSGGSMPVVPPTTSPNMSNVSLTIGDAPPAGVTILRFELQVTAATMQPATAGAAPVSMLPRPTEVELEHLQTEPAFLANLNVPAGTYNSLTATFASPQMTILNQTGQTLTVGTQNCANNQVCNLTPTLNQMTATVQAPTSPFPITLAANSPLALLLHFDINNSVQGDLSVTPTISLKQLPPLPTGEFVRFHIVGTVSAVNSPDFTLQTAFGNQSLTIVTDNNTQYEFGNSCQADNFSCIQKGQLLQVKVKLMPGGELLAAEVKLFQNAGLPNIEGIVTSANAAQNQFQVVLTFFEDDAGHDFGGLNFGFRLTIQPTASATYSVDSDGITVPAGLSFASVQDIFVGQVVRFHPVLPITVGGMGQFTIGTDSVTLEPSEITGTVSAVNASATPPNFTLGGLPPLFTKAGVMQLEVEPVMGTDFENVSGLSGLNPNDTVSVAGLLFNPVSGPVVIAERVAKRQPDNF
jgi:hypothetical protein